MHPTDTNPPLFATECFEFTVEVYPTHVAYRQYWSQQGSVPLADIVSVEQPREGLANVIVTTRAGTSVGFLVCREDRAALCAAIRDAQRYARTIGKRRETHTTRRNSLRTTPEASPAV
jgi:hypothetical protein